MKTYSHFYRSIIVVIVILLPYIVGFSPNPGDSTSTTISVAVGRGSYADVSRDCSGNVTGVTEIPHTDAGVSVKQTFTAVQVGVKAGILSFDSPSYSGNNTYLSVYNENPTGTMHYVTPTLGINTQYFELNAGAMFTDDNGWAFLMSKGIGDRSYNAQKIFPAGSLRIGDRDDIYISSGLCDNLPLITGGSLLDFGFGFHFHTKRNGYLWLGVGAWPYDGGVFSVKAGIPLSDKVALDLHGALNSGAATEYGISVGTTIAVH